MNDQEAIKIQFNGVKDSDGKITEESKQNYFKALAIAGNRLIECQWHEYHEGSYFLPVGDALLDIEFDDGSNGTYVGFGWWKTEGDETIHYLIPKSSLTGEYKIKHWMKMPQYQKKED